MGRYEFYHWVWGKALAELTLRDPAFIASVQAFDRLSELGDVVLSGTPQPTWHFDARWTQVFEACVDVEWQVRRLNRCLSKLNPAVYEGLEGSEAAAEFDYHIASFFMHCYALKEKSERLVTLAFRHFSRLFNANSPMRASSWVHRIKTDLGNRIDPIRSHLVHGVGGRGAWVTGITEKQLWEGTMAVQLTPQRFLDEFPIPDGIRRRRTWYRRLAVVTPDLLDRLDRILDELREELDKVAARATT